MSSPALPAAVTVTVTAEQAGTTAGEVLRAAGITDSAVAQVAGQLRDLAHVVAEGDVVEQVPYASADGRAVLRHSAAHVLAQAVQNLFPGTRLGIGPPIADGFYYDFLPERPFTPQDVTAIEQRMTQIVRQRQRFSRRVVSESDAREELADEPFKLELIDLKGGADAEGADVEVDPSAAELSIYDNLAGEDLMWKDLCRGPHLPTTRDIPAFALMRTAAAYWRGSEKNPQLQRIYGTAWESKSALKTHLSMLEEAEKRDHRRLGAELDLFSFPDEIGSGLAVFHPKGGTVRRVMEDYSRQRHEQAGYSFVNTPHITKEQLFLTSGHLPYYADTMFPPMQFEGADYYLKPMNCPFHLLVYKSRGRSYRDLPQRFFEFGTVYRYEKSGVVHGLTRVRGLTMDDAHIFCTEQQLAGELAGVLSFVLELLRDFGLTDFFLELSTRDESDKFIGGQAQWDDATAALWAAADASGLELVPDPGGAAFYGPKISVQARDAIGRSWQMSTIQLDFNQPERFDAEYQAADGSRQRPVMIHRALFGSIERFFGVLLEHYAGAFPAWLAPVQVVGIPITSEHDGYVQDVAVRLRKHGIRVEVDSSEDRMQKKIRNAQKSKVPFMLLAGDEDLGKGAVSFRYRDGTQENGVPVDEAVAKLVAAVEQRR
ncbi:MAG: threonine--tRNA ligase [Actinomycetota bacterium]|nr:threonine--tRNA ligase [Actinomycetota bacterium]